MKHILSTLLLLAISLSLFSAPKRELNEIMKASQDSISIAIYKMEFSKAIVIIERLLAGNIDSLMVRNLSLEKARCLKKLYKFKEAASLLVEINEKSLSPDVIDVEVMVELADTYISLGNVDSAIPTYHFLKTAFPMNMYYALRYANLLYRLDMYEDAINEGKNILRSDFTHYSVLSLVGDSFNKIEESDSALVYYNRMLGINPMDYRVLDKKSKILLSKKEYPEVIELAENYLSRDSVNLIINSIYGLALHLDTQYMDSTYNTHYCLGLNHYMIDNYFEAEIYFEKAFQADSSDVNLVYYYAISTTWPSYRIDRMVKLLDYAYSLTQPESLLVGKVYSGYTASYFKLKRYKDAIPYYIKSYKYNPSHIPALSALGYCYELEKDYKKAKEYYRAYLNVTEDSEDYNSVETRIEKVKGELFWI